jgi:hypothetical protein
MTKLRIIAVADNGDRSNLIGKLIESGSNATDGNAFTCESLFETTALKRLDIGISNLKSFFLSGSSQEKERLKFELEQSPNLILLFVGSKALVSPHFEYAMKLISSSIARSANHRIPVITLISTPLEIARLALPKHSTNVIATWAETPVPIPAMETQTKDAFGIAIKDITDTFPQEPEVGVGILLVNKAGDFLLTERLRNPGRGLYGTIGGALKYKSKISDSITILAKKQFGICSPIELGQLLACTNMELIAEGNKPDSHFIDLTFLAFTNDSDAWPSDVLRHKAISNADGTKCWFSLEEMAAFFFCKQLFPPVSSAFHQYCCLKALAVVANATNAHPKKPVGHPWGEQMHSSDIALLTRIANHPNSGLQSSLYYVN